MSTCKYLNIHSVACFSWDFVLIVAYCNSLIETFQNADFFKRLRLSKSVLLSVKFLSLFFNLDVQTQAMYQMMDPGFVGLIFSCFNDDTASAVIAHSTEFESAILCCNCY